jgi:hypothetical protein
LIQAPRHDEHEHVIVVAGLGFDEASVHADGPPMGCRLHQWSAADTAVRGRTSSVHRRVG